MNCQRPVCYTFNDVFFLYESLVGELPFSETVWSRLYCVVILASCANKYVSNWFSGCNCPFVQSTCAQRVTTGCKNKQAERCRCSYQAAAWYEWLWQSPRYFQWYSFWTILCLQSACCCEWWVQLAVPLSYSVEASFVSGVVGQGAGSCWWVRVRASLALARRCAVWWQCERWLDQQYSSSSSCWDHVRILPNLTPPL